MDSNLRIFPHDMKFFDAAKAVANQSTFDRFHVGCVVVYQGKIISSACNTRKPDPLQAKYNVHRHFNNIHKSNCVHSGHAELRALKHIPYTVAQNINWSKVKVFVYRIAPGLPRGVGLSRPCPACMQYIHDLGIRDIFYSTEYGFAHEVLEYWDGEC